MRIVTWNCFRGNPSDRFAELRTLAPDICALQECSQPSASDALTIPWFGDNPRQGISVIAANGYRVEPGPVDESIQDTGFPVIINTPGNHTIHMLAIWSKPNPTYVASIARCLASYKRFLTERESIILGDFNSHSQWDKPRDEWTHARLVQVLRDEFQLMSAFHTWDQSGVEPPTLYWQWKESQPFHIDYCFIPALWKNRLASVQIGSYSDWKSSDHRP